MILRWQCPKCYTYQIGEVAYQPKDMFEEGSTIKVACKYCRQEIILENKLTHHVSNCIASYENDKKSKVVISYWE